MAIEPKRSFKDVTMFHRTLMCSSTDKIVVAIFTIVLRPKWLTVMTMIVGHNLNMQREWKKNYRKREKHLSRSDGGKFQLGVLLMLNKQRASLSAKPRRNTQLLITVDIFFKSSSQPWPPFTCRWALLLLSFPQSHCAKLDNMSELAWSNLMLANEKTDRNGIS